LAVAGVSILIGFGFNSIAGSNRATYEFNANSEILDSCLGAIGAMEDASGLNLSKDPEIEYDSEGWNYSRYKCSFRATDGNGRDIGPVGVRVAIYTDGDAVNPTENRLQEVRQDSGVRVISETVSGYEFGFCYEYTNPSGDPGTQMCSARDGNLEVDIDASTLEIADVQEMAVELLPFLKSAFAVK
jgi:hypothetical protein